MSSASEIRAFFIHLRWHYQLLVLSGAYLLGGLYREHLDVRSFLLQLLNVQLLLNGGVTAYNSYYDEDTGPVGGVEHPPKMTAWMLPASLLVQMIGFAFAIPEGPTFLASFATTMGLSILYSSKRTRWKGRPLLSLVCVGVGTGVSTFLMGFLAGGGDELDPRILVASAGVALVLLSMFPVSQVFQIDADRAKGDRTFAVAYGLRGVRWFFASATAAGVSILSATLFVDTPALSAAVLCVGLVAGVINGRALFRLEGTAAEYPTVMRMKYTASLSFVLLLSLALAGRAVGFL